MNDTIRDIISQLETSEKNNERVLLVIDGRCGAGKTTLASRISEKFTCNVFHMDDFYLPAAEQTDERMKEPGGNISFGRFLSEIIMPIENSADIAYRPFVCRIQDYGDTQIMPARNINIIEGTYSCHPKLRGAYERLCGAEDDIGAMRFIRIFLDIDCKKQIERIRTRVGEQRLKMFEDKWIPREEEYFKLYSVREYCKNVIWEWEV